MVKGRNATIKALVEKIVDVDGPKGKAVVKLEQLHERLMRELGEADNPQEQTRLSHDLEFLEGFQSTPAAQIADLIAAQKKINP